MNETKIVIPFDFPFAILETRNEKRVYAVADGQYTYGPLSLFQHHNDEKYSTIPDSEELPSALPCKEYYIVESDSDTKSAIEIIDEKRGRIYVKEVSQLQSRTSSNRACLHTPPRSQSVTSKRIAKNINQQSLSYATPKRTMRK